MLPGFHWFCSHLFGKSALFSSKVHTSIFSSHNLCGKTPKTWPVSLLVSSFPKVESGNTFNFLLASRGKWWHNASLCPGVRCPRGPRGLDSERIPLPQSSMAGSNNSLFMATYDYKTKGKMVSLAARRLVNGCFWTPCFVEHYVYPLRWTNIDVDKKLWM